MLTVTERQCYLGYFLKFAYVSSYLQTKSFARKQDCNFRTALTKPIKLHFLKIAR